MQIFSVNHWVPWKGKVRGNHTTLNMGTEGGEGSRKGRKGRIEWEEMEGKEGRGGSIEREGGRGESREGRMKREEVGREGGRAEEWGITASIQCTVVICGF